MLVKLSIRPDSGLGLTIYDFWYKTLRNVDLYTMKLCIYIYIDGWKENRGYNSKGDSKKANGGNISTRTYPSVNS